MEGIRQTNYFVNENPEIILELRVSPAGGKDFPATLRTVVPRVRIPRVQPGCVVTVAYDPSRTSDVALALEDEPAR